ncbi:hypothetical protein LINGRAHAP2_LOCUS33732 [Linum grandiflorum]
MTKLVIAGLMVLVLGCCFSIHTATAVVLRCGFDANTHGEFPYNLKAVLNSLATDTTPAFPRYSRYYPDTTTKGSAMGIANCHTESEKECRKCLGDARDSLGSCEQRMDGSYVASFCYMRFWQVEGNTN